jgi:ribosomal protein S20
MNTKTAKKEFRKSQRRNFLNNLKRNNAKKIKRKLLAFTSTSEVKEPLYVSMNENLSKYNSILAKMAKTGLIHKKKASRLVSRMSLKVNSSALRLSK